MILNFGFIDLKNEDTIAKINQTIIKRRLNIFEIIYYR
jgi:hypothetical protein